MNWQLKESRANELQARFSLHNGGMRVPYRCKNQNVYLIVDGEKQWIAYSDIDEHDTQRIQGLLQPGETVETGWKELGAYEFDDQFFGDGGGVWVRITPDEVEWVLHGKMPTGNSC